MRYFIILFTLPVLLLIPPKVVAQKSPSTLKTISYNIWNGFDWGKDEDRREKLVNWVTSQQADVVALQELCGYTAEKLQEDATKWGHSYSVLLKTTGYSVGITSNKPIFHTEKLRKGLHHGALHVNTHNIDFVVVHFSPSSYQKRRKEVQIILRKLDAIRLQNDRYIVLGDFNAVSPFDADGYAEDGYYVKRLRKGNEGKGESGNLFQNNLEYGVMSAFLAFPLQDVVRNHSQNMRVRGSFPGMVLASKTETEAQLKERIHRIDYILVSPALEQKCSSAKVYNGASTAYLSDHYPVVAEFKW